MSMLFKYIELFISCGDKFSTHYIIIILFLFLFQQVDCATKISTIFTSTASKEQKERSLSTDFSCILVKNPDVFSKDDEFVSYYCENFMLGGLVPHGCVEIHV